MPHRTDNPVQKAPRVSRKGYYAATIANVICCLAYTALLIWFGGWLLSNI